VQESVRLFGLGMMYADILKVVDIAAGSTSSLGREYSCGVSNVGVVDLLPAAAEESLPKETGNLFGFFGVSAPLPLSVSEAYYGTSHARNGVLCQLSCQTVNGELFGCLQFPEPVVTREKAELLRKKVEAFTGRVVS
jgi:hypothetical protein